ncbi:glycosyltransferase family 9 protein [Thermodesulfovibrio yellowstonii]|nr:glycosyltransferase family 9 protein [Thermodesulfovibrio islandicus]
MTTYLLSKLRIKFPKANIFNAIPEAFTDLYSSSPYNVKTIGFSVFNWKSFLRLLKLPKIDIAFVPGDNRYGWTAFAIGAKWIVGHEGDRPKYKNWCFNELIPYPDNPESLSDIFSDLVEDNNKISFSKEDWLQPKFDKFELPSSDYVLFHVGCKSKLKSWDSENWKFLIKYFKNKNFNVAISCGPNESDILKFFDSENYDISFYPGNLNLCQMWELMKNAKLIISLDNGIAHLGKIIGTPTICLYGPASDILYGKGDFFKYSSFYPIIKKIECRNQNRIFKRDVKWIQTCERLYPSCSNPKCMKAINVEDVIKVVEKII